MAKSEEKKPTKTELEILSVLWEKGSLTVREVFELMNSTRRTSYTTILKLMQIMHEKGLVSRNEKNRAHIYTAKLKQNETGKAMLVELLEKVFSGSASKLVQQVLEEETTTDEDIREIRRMISSAEKEARKK